MFGRLNATLEDDVLTRYADVNLGVAVSLGERGLIVPVIRRAQELSVEGLAAAIRELARPGAGGRARPGRGPGSDVHDHQPGPVGDDRGNADHQPAAGRDPRPRGRRPAAVVVGGDGIAIRPMANLCLSWDHRALDGVLAAEFLADVRARIERWDG